MGCAKPILPLQHLLLHLSIPTISHSLTSHSFQFHQSNKAFVANDSLCRHALGGFDGKSMVPSTEVYDPRLDTWIPGDPMKKSRGYSAAAVVKDSIFVIGGLESNEDIVGTVECFKEGQGWEEKNTKVIGKRCFLSAIAL